MYTSSTHARFRKTYPVAVDKLVPDSIGQCDGCAFAATATIAALMSSPLH